LCIAKTPSCIILLAFSGFDDDPTLYRSSPISDLFTGAHVYLLCPLSIFPFAVSFPISTSNRNPRSPATAYRSQPDSQTIENSSARSTPLGLTLKTLERLARSAHHQAHTQAPEVLIFDLDATDDPLHGHQEGRFFHGYYRNYCYLPL
jgi:Transposase DDE domain group 1